MKKTTENTEKREERLSSVAVFWAQVEENMCIIEQTDEENG